MELTNRKVTYPNRRRLEVKSITTDSSGKITSLDVDIKRNNIEGSIIEEGTPLTAEGLGKALREELYGVVMETSEVIVWTQKKDSKNSSESTIKYRGPKLYAKPISTDEYEMTVTNKNGMSSTIQLTEGPGLAGALSNLEIKYYIELYSDELYKHYVTRVKGVIKYYCMSTNPVD